MGGHCGAEQLDGDSGVISMAEDGLKVFDELGGMWVVDVESLNCQGAMHQSSGEASLHS